MAEGMGKMTTSPDTEQELFDLCKKVYELTKWVHPNQNMHYDVHSKIAYPLYTSDYLLEKLKKLHVQVTSSGDAGFTRKGLMINRASDTPLKALLKLVIALKEAGVEL